MSRNFELLRQAQPNADPLELISVPGEVTPAPPVRYQAPPRRAVAGVPAVTETDWLRAIKVLKKHWRPGALLAAVVFSAVALLTFLTRPTYEPTATVQIDPPGSEVFSMQGNNTSSSPTEYIATQAKNLQSDQLALHVIRALNLAQNPDFAGKAAAAAPGDTGAAPSDSPQLTAAETQALKTFQKRVVVNRDVTSHLVYVSVGAHDPVLAAAATNTLVNQFIERDYRLRHEAIVQSSEWLQKQLDDIRQRMEASNQTLAEFQKSSGIAALGDNQNTFAEQMTELNRQLMQAQADRIQLQSYLSKFSGQASSSLPQISGNPVVQVLTQKLAEVRAQLAENLAVYGKNHPIVKKLQNQADELQSQLEAQRGAIVKDLKTSYTAAQAREQMMESQMKGTTKQLALMAQYTALKKEADANTQLYNNLFAKIKEAGINAESKSSPVHVVDNARVLDHPTRPHRLANLALGLVAGLFGGVLLAFIREGFDTTVHTAEDVRKCLGTGSVSIMPVIGAGPAASGVKLLSSQGGAEGASSVFLLERPNSPEAEALRGLYTSVRLSSQHGRPPQAILVASPYPGEGKTTLSVNLSIALAQTGSTCIVDADLRKEGVAGLLGIKPAHGLSDVLANQMKLDEVLVPAGNIPNLTLLSTGPAVTDPAQLVTSGAMSEVIRQLRMRFDFVLVDSPPIVPFADGRALSTLVDGVVLVGRSGVTKREGLARALELLQEVQCAPILDVVLNAAESAFINYGHYRYGYGHAQGNGKGKSNGKGNGNGHPKVA
jgi:capsular exopolysaccharide synthesis family protein